MRGQKKGDGFRVNSDIYAKEIRVVADDGEMLGVMTVPQALDLARAKGLDLIEIAPNVTPPTCKIMDYGKWKYENKKKAVQARKNQVTVDIKEIQIRPRTELHDLNTKVRHAKRFLLDGAKVKLTLRFSGREMAHQEHGMETLNKVTEMLNDLALVEVAPKKEGRKVFCMLAPDKDKVKDYLKMKKAEKKAEEKAVKKAEEKPVASE